MCYFASRKIRFCLVGIMAFAFISCKDDVIQTAEDMEAMADEYIEPSIEQFKEPPEPKISYKKARNFNKASEAIIIMGQEWAEKMTEMDDEEQLRMAAAYEKAQDDLIRKFGLSGKEEFRWIQTKALPEPSNKNIFARAGVFK
ncbi:MAG: hypothetical protein FWC15_01260 [Fibromonadales bacterium]|nr:hypothetical protein [Fibromonadales bacterium]